MTINQSSFHRSNSAPSPSSTTASLPIPIKGSRSNLARAESAPFPRVHSINIDSTAMRESQSHPISLDNLVTLMIEDFTTSNNSPFPKRQLADKLRKHALDASNALSAIQSVSQLYPYLLNGYQPNLSHTLNQSEIFANAHDLLLTATSEFLDRCLRKLEPNELLALANDPQDPLHERVMDELNTRDHNSHLTQA